jgi:hypothetical protein
MNAFLSAPSPTSARANNGRIEVKELQISELDFRAEILRWRRRGVHSCKVRDLHAVLVRIACAAVAPGGLRFPHVHDELRICDTARMRAAED